MSDHIEIKIDGKKLTPERFLEAVESFFELVQGVSKNISKIPVNWSVEVDKGSTVVRVRADDPTEDVNQSIDAVIRGVSALRMGIKTIPFGFTKEEVRAAKKLATLKDGNEIESAFIQNGGAPEDLAVTIVPTADAILVGENHIAFGSVEGTIDTMSAKQAFCCMIWEPIYRRDITCYLTETKLQADAVDAFVKRRRVSVGGLIHYSKEGFPTSISADKIKMFPLESELPNVEDIQAIYRQYK